MTKLEHKVISREEILQELQSLGDIEIDYVKFAAERSTGLANIKCLFYHQGELASIWVIQDIVSDKNFSIKIKIIAHYNY